MAYLGRAYGGGINPSWNLFEAEVLNFDNVTSASSNESTDQIAVFGGYVEGVTTKEITINFNSSTIPVAVGDAVGNGIVTSISRDIPADGVINSTVTIAYR